MPKPLQLIQQATGAFDIESKPLAFRNLQFSANAGPDGQLDSREAIVAVESNDGECFTFRFLWKDRTRPFQGEAKLRITGAAALWKLSLRPVDNGAWELVSTSELSGKLDGWTTPLTNLQMFHAENVRGVSQGHSLLSGEYFVPLERWSFPVNQGRWNAFPGTWLGNSCGGEGIVIGPLSQRVWRHLHHCHVLPGGDLFLEGKMIASGVASRPFPPGTAYEGEEVYIEFVSATAPLAAFAGYVEALSQRLKPACKTSPLRHALFWDSWNDRKPYFWDVSEALLQRTADTVIRHFPTIASLEIDDGYAQAGFDEIEPDQWTLLEHGHTFGNGPRTIKKPRRLGAAFAAEPDHALARDRFPRGLAPVAAEIRNQGLVPAIWIGLHSVLAPVLSKEHPDWFCRYDPQPGDDPELEKVFGRCAAYRHDVLDPSNPEVRAYFERLFDLLFREWGFEAVKLDFWSYVFQNPGFRLAFPDKTATEWQTWFFETLRNRLPKSTYVCLACDLSTGNPFLSPWVDTIRYGIDIGNGKWSSIFNTALAGTALLHLQSYRFYLLNADSAGLLNQLPENERQVFWAWAAVTRSLCETAGDLAMTAREELRQLQRLLLAIHNGSTSWAGEDEHLKRNEPASVVFAEGSQFGLEIDSPFLPDRIAAVFNWSDTARTVEVSSVRAGIDEFAPLLDVEFFSGVPVMRQTPVWQITLPPRSVRLSHLSRHIKTPRLLHSRWRVEQTAFDGNRFDLNLLGDDPDGFILYWPFDSKPILHHSTIQANMKSLEKHLYNIRFILMEDRLTPCHQIFLVH